MKSIKNRLDVPDGYDQVDIFRMLMRCLGGVRERRKRRQKYDLAGTIQLIKEAKKILVLTGAGISGILIFTKTYIHCYSVLWHSRLPFTQWPLCKACCRLPRITWSPIHVLPSLFSPWSSTLFSICKRNLPRKLWTITLTQVHRSVREESETKKTLLAEYRRPGAAGWNWKSRTGNCRIF